jgi:hypothetical protein
VTPVPTLERAWVSQLLGPHCFMKPRAFTLSHGSSSNPLYECLDTPETFQSTFSEG